jgi:hypothetical protein
MFVGTQDRLVSLVRLLATFGNECCPAMLRSRRLAVHSTASLQCIFTTE